MNLNISRDPADMIAALTRAAAEGEERFAAALEQVPAAAYRTDRNGTVTHFNRACVRFAGRRPVARRDRWCVTWKLYTEEGGFLPHDECPMAIALRENREVRGARAVAERPNGRRVLFAPYPTPLCDEQGNLVGAVNLLVDLSGSGRRPHRARTAPTVGSGPLPNGHTVRKFCAIFGPRDPVGLNTLSFEAPDLAEAFTALAALDCRHPLQIWCDDRYFGRFQRVVEGSVSYWRLVGDITDARMAVHTAPDRRRDQAASGGIKSGAVVKQRGLAAKKRAGPRANRPP